NPAGARCVSARSTPGIATIFWRPPCLVATLLLRLAIRLPTSAAGLLPDAPSRPIACSRRTPCTRVDRPPGTKDNGYRWMRLPTRILEKKCFRECHVFHGIVELPDR